MSKYILSITVIYTCDTCDKSEKVHGDVLPQGWVKTDYKQYCSLKCKKEVHYLVRSGPIDLRATQEGEQMQSKDEVRKEIENRAVHDVVDTVSVEEALDIIAALLDNNDGPQLCRYCWSAFRDGEKAKHEDDCPVKRAIKFLEDHGEGE